MFQVTVKDVKGRFVVRRKFDTEQAAWNFFDEWNPNLYALEFKNLFPLKRAA